MADKPRQIRVSPRIEVVQTTLRKKPTPALWGWLGSSGLVQSQHHQVRILLGSRFVRPCWSALQAIRGQPGGSHVRGRAWADPPGKTSGMPFWVGSKQGANLMVNAWADTHRGRGTRDRCRSNCGNTLLATAFTPGLPAPAAINTQGAVGFVSALSRIADGCGLFNQGFS